jgi:hypothetical protein
VPLETRRQAREPLGTLRENLERVMRRLSHHVEDPGDVGFGDVAMEEI